MVPSPLRMLPTSCPADLKDGVADLHLRAGSDVVETAATGGGGGIAAEGRGQQGQERVAAAAAVVVNAAAKGARRIATQVQNATVTTPVLANALLARAPPLPSTWLPLKVRR